MIRNLLLIGAMLLSATAPASAQTDFPRTVIDRSGASVTIPARPAVVAVIGSDPILTRLLSATDLRAVDPERADLSGVGLLVTPTLYAAAYPALINSAGVPVFRTAAWTSLQDWRETVIALGRATGRDTEAAALANRLDRRLRWLDKRLRAVPPVRALILTPEGYTFGAKTFIDDLVAAADGINVAADYADFRQIDDRALRALAPDVILLSPAWPDAAAFRNSYSDLAARVVRLPFSPTQPSDPAAALLALTVALHPQIWLHLN
jgi:ABC-type Fe3+-hydroxamate transport system substrate-binding protein